MDSLFNDKKKQKSLVFMAHVYVGDPSIGFSKELIKTLHKSGVDILELGIPFSDPIADGPVFQAACQRALDSGTTPDKVFDLIKDLQKDNLDAPIILPPSMRKYL